METNTPIARSGSKEQDLDDSDEDKIPEIKDIYDHIYGNVQSKLEFYEGKKTNDSDKNLERTLANGCENGVQASNSVPVTPTTPDVPVFLFTNNEEPTTNVAKKSIEKRPKPDPNLDLLKDCNVKCAKCDKIDFVNDRSEVLTEINLNIKLELESVKNNLKKEIAKNNELNYEIANIEVALETFYKEAKFQKSALASIYANVKDYTTLKQKRDDENYTYKRIKAIADYMETLKCKLEHQDRIIKSDFVENPYYTDLIMKHDAVRQQLDALSKENHELKGEIKKKAEEEVETIKELNRQKFRIENKCKEIENYYKGELAAKDGSIRELASDHSRALDEVRAQLVEKEAETLQTRKTFEAKVNNYKQELVVVYRKWKELKSKNGVGDL